MKYYYIQQKKKRKKTRSMEICSARGQISRKNDTHSTAICAMDHKWDSSKIRHDTSAIILEQFTNSRK